MFSFILSLVIIKSASSDLIYDIEQNETIGNWTLGPEIRSVIPLEPPGFAIFFSGVWSQNADDPVIGYKLNVAEKAAGPPDESTLRSDKWKVVDDVLKIVQRKTNFTHVFTAKYKSSPFVIEIPVIYREFMYRVRVVHVVPEMQYAVKVRAYTKALDGPWSKPVRGYIDGRGHRSKQHRPDGYFPMLG